jgi:Uma2 family endonuclease
MLIEAPRLVIEVLSPGTESRDRGIKFRAYQACETLQEIVLVSQFAPYVEVWRRNAQDPDNPGSWLYSHYRPGDTVELASLHVQIPVATIYQGLSFDEDEDE